MSYQFPPDVDELVRKQMETGDYGTEDDVLREALRSLSEQRDDWVILKILPKNLTRKKPNSM